jgi:preprotein translocase subunit SecA
LGKRRKSGQKFAKPDDYFAWGPFEIARFGKNLIWKAHATAAQVEAVQARRAKHFPVIVGEIDALVSSIAGRIARLPPGRLLHRAWWEHAAIVLGLGGKKVAESDQLAAMRMLDYVQSVIAAVKPRSYDEDVSEDDWKKLKADVTTLFHHLTIDYQMCLTAHRRVQDPGLDMELEEFRFRNEIFWMNIRGKRYQPHERQALLDVLAPHSDILFKLFGIDARALVYELDKVLAKLTRGLADAVPELKRFHKDALDRFEALAGDHDGLSFDALVGKVFEDNDLAARGRAVTGEVFGMDLFDVGKNTALPQALLDALSWSPGEDAEFFAPGEFCGWPLRIWPIMRRPFIRLDGQIFCFDIFSLFDNIYRVLRRVVVSREPSYDDTWNKRQQAVSEELPFTYLARLLPGARTYRPVYYWWAPRGGRAQRHEADGLVIFDDHLLVIEVKGGAFTYTSPANDLPAHLESLRALLQAPARQGSRFVDYLESADEVPIADADHKEIGRLRRRDYRHITICAVTLDAFTALAARAQHLAPVGIDIGRRAVWPLSIDDLRVYAELFDNPLVFLHFIEQRMRAGQSRHVDLNDEMDHLGLYVAQNNYSQYAAEVMANKFDRLSFDGFSTPIDEYFSTLLCGDPSKLPRQPMPARLADIIRLLAHSGDPGRCELASFLLDAAGDFRSQFAGRIEEALRENKKLHRARPLSIYGRMAMTLYVWSPSAPRHATSAEQHARAVMVAANETSRRLIELEYTDDGVLIAAHMKHVSLSGLGYTELERVKAAALSLQQQRLEQALTKGKIGRNAPCPCGSGVKYKRCHGRRV